MKKKFLVLLLAITMLAALVIPAVAANSADPDSNAPEPKPGYSLLGCDMKWNANDLATAKANFILSGSKDKIPPSTALTPVTSARTSANGDKISSNAHSGDYPGIYFYWDDKQKDDGILKVDPLVFLLFEDNQFVVTAKNSNAYWDYTIRPKDGVPTKDGYLLYQIPRYFMTADKKGKLTNDELKNINMIFISGNYKPARVWVNKIWLNEEGKPIFNGVSNLNAGLKFSGQFKLGFNEIKFNDYTSAAKGISITITETGMPAGFAFVDASAIALLGGSSKVQNGVKFMVFPGCVSLANFTNQKQWAKLEIVKIWKDADGNKITDPNRIAELEANMVFSIDGAPKALNTVYKVKEGTYTVAEANCPAGFAPVGDDSVSVTVAAGGKKTVTFVNQEVKITNYATISLMKKTDGITWTEWLSDYSAEKQAELLAGIAFKLYPVAAKGAAYSGEPVATGELTALAETIQWDYLGKTGVPAGWYAVVEELTGLAAMVFDQPDPMYIYVTDSGYDSAGTQIVSGPAYGALCETGGGSLTTGPFKLPEVWNEQLKADPNLQKMLDAGAQWIWAPTASGTDDTHRFGVTGSEVRFDFMVGVDKDIEIPIYFAADNAAAIYVDGELAAWTDTAFDGRTVPASIASDFDITAQSFFDKTFDGFDGGWGTGWCHVYEKMIKLSEGENTITIFAANSAQTVGTGTPNDGYDTTNNPCGLLFAFEAPGASFDNTERIVEYGRAVVPMVSDANQGAVEVSENNWGLDCWPQISDQFRTPSAWDELTGEFAAIEPLTDPYGLFIWDKPEANVMADQFGEDIAYLRFEYDIPADHINPHNFEFTDFIISADNEFALIVNGAVLQVSDNFKNVVTGVGWNDTADVISAFDLGFLAQFSGAFWDLNNPANNLYGMYGWNKPYTISADEIRDAFLASGDSTVVIEVYAYNIPEISNPNPGAVAAGFRNGGYGNPAMVIFAGSFTYEYDK